MELSTVIYIIRDDEELEVEVVGHAYHGLKGRYYGPAENCFPDEPAEIEFEVAFVDGKQIELTEDELIQADKALESAYEDECYA
jgi:hypothetical protein